MTSPPRCYVTWPLIDSWSEKVPVQCASQLAISLCAARTKQSVRPGSRGEERREGEMELAYECKVNGGEVEGTEVTDRRQVH